MTHFSGSPPLSPAAPTSSSTEKVLLRVLKEPAQGSLEGPPHKALLLRKEWQLTSLTSSWGRTRAQDHRWLCRALTVLQGALDKPVTQEEGDLAHCTLSWVPSYKYLLEK